MFLERILEKQYAEVGRRKDRVPLQTLLKELGMHPPEIRPFRQNLRGAKIRLIAEVKKASPSKGLLCPDFDPAGLGTCYEQAGAAGISVLTEEQFFLGSLDNLKRVKENTIRTPVLRKDFIVDPYQLVEARLYGADAVLLIVAALLPERLRLLLTETGKLGMDALVEVHDAREVKVALDCGATLIGVNNRNLQSFKVNRETTFQLLAAIPAAIVRVSESGISTRHDIQKLEAAGTDAVLIGESLVTAADPAKKIKELFCEARDERREV
jgi:indole-3-glycerol phosphate synthase